MSEAWNHYENAATGLSIEYPPAWNYEEDVSIGGVFFAHDSTISGQETNPLAPVVNVLASRQPEMSLDDYTQQQVVRLRQRSIGNPSDFKLDRSASFGGHPAHRAICTLQVDPTRTVRLYSIWAKVNDWIYLVHFTCDIFEFSMHQRVVLRMLNSVKLLTPRAKTALLHSYYDPQLLLRINYPASFEQIYPVAMKKKSSGSVSPTSPRMPRSKPLLHLRDRFQGPEKEDFMRFITLVAHKRRRKPGCAQEVVQEEIERCIEQLDQMMVRQVFLSWTNVDSRECRVMEFQSDSIFERSWYRQVFFVNEQALPVEEDSIDRVEKISTNEQAQTMDNETKPTTTTPDTVYDLLILTLQSTGPQSDDTTTSLFQLTEESVKFYARSEETGAGTRRWSRWEHLLLQFGLFFDPELYVCKDAGMPFAEALFVHRDDLVGSVVPDDSTTFSIVVRQVPPESKVNLTSIGEDIIDNLSQLYTVEVLKTENSQLNGRDCRLIISRGITNSPGEHVQMYFAHKLVVNEETGVAVWFAFAATESKWQQEWVNVDSYLATLYWK